jgi:hypothetical protein
MISLCYGARCDGAGNERSNRFGNLGEKSRGFRVWGVLYGVPAAGNTILGLVAPDFGRWPNLAEIFFRHKFLLGTHG